MKQLAYHNSEVMGDINDFSESSEYCNIIKRLHDEKCEEIRVYENYHDMCGIFKSTVENTPKFIIWLSKELTQNKSERTLVDGWLFGSDSIEEIYKKIYDLHPMMDSEDIDWLKNEVKEKGWV